MHRISKKLKEKFTVSFEFFPPKTDEGLANLLTTVENLTSFKENFKPDFVSITFGAGGSTKEKTTDIALLIKEKYNITVLEHFTCYGLSLEEIRKFVTEIKNHGIINILALRGDKPRNNPNFIPAENSLKHASDLVEFILKINDFDVGVAAYPEGHPEAESLEQDVEFLKLKVDKGAKFAITQLFLDNNDFYEFMNIVQKKGINIPIIPGFLPFVSYKNIVTFTELSKAKLPDNLRKKIEAHKEDDEYITKLGIEYTINQIKDLKDNLEIPGIHLFTLNRSYSSIKVLEEIL